MKFTALLLAVCVAASQAMMTPKTVQPLMGAITTGQHQFLFSDTGDFIYQNYFGRHIYFTKLAVPEANTLYEVAIHAKDIPDGKIVLNNLWNFFTGGDYNTQEFGTVAYWADQYQVFFGILREWPGTFDDGKFQEFLHVIKTAVGDGKLHQVFYDVFMCFGHVQMAGSYCPQYLMAAYKAGVSATDGMFHQYFGGAYPAYNQYNQFPTGYYGNQGVYGNGIWGKLFGGKYFGGYGSSYPTAYGGQYGSGVFGKLFGSQYNKPLYPYSGFGNMYGQGYGFGGQGYGYSTPYYGNYRYGAYPYGGQYYGYGQQYGQYAPLANYGLGQVVA